MENNSILLRYGEVGLKSDRNRAFFEKLYLRAIRESLKKHEFLDFQIISYGKRFVIHHNYSNKILPILQKIPGIQSISPAFHFLFKTQQEIISELIPLSKPLIENKTFRITTRRVGKHDFKSMDLSMNLGKELEKFNTKVDLTNPDVTLFIEIRDEHCYFYTEDFSGVGGLPPTSAGKVLCLFSGGIDSPVAAYQMLKRGCSVDFIYINMLGDAPFNEIAKVYNELIDNYVYGYTPKFHVINAAEIVEKIKSDVDDSLRQIFLKIIFYKIAEKIAIKNKHLAIVTGEALSQKSSQTVASLGVINSQINTLVLRPLLGYDKIEITKIARELNTLVLSEKVKEYCNLSEGPVTTTPTQDVLTKFPDLSKEIELACEDEIVFKGKLDLVEEKIEFDEKDFKKPLIVDIRSQTDTKNQPIEANIRIEYPEIFHHFEEFKKEEDYIIVCEYGLRSFDVASRLRKEGIRAISKSFKQFLNVNDVCERK